MVLSGGHLEKIMLKLITTPLGTSTTCIQCSLQADCLKFLVCSRLSLAGLCLCSDYGQ